MAILGLVIALAITTFRDDRHTSTSAVLLNQVNFELGLWRDPNLSTAAMSSGRAIREVTSNQNVGLGLLGLVPSTASQATFANVDLPSSSGILGLWETWPCVVLSAPSGARTDLHVQVKDGVPTVTNQDRWTWDAASFTLSSGDDWRLQLAELVLASDSFDIEVKPLAAMADWIREELRARSAGAPEILEVTYTDVDPGRATIILEGILSAYAGSGRRQLESLASNLQTKIEAEEARLFVRLDEISDRRSSLMARAETGDTEISLEAESLRLVELDAEITQARLRNTRLATAKTVTHNAESILDWESDLPGAIPILEQLAVSVGAHDGAAGNRLREMLRQMVEQASARALANLQGLEAARALVAQRIMDLVTAQNEALALSGESLGASELLASLALRKQQTLATLATMAPTVTRIEETRVPIKLERLTTLVIALLGCLAGLLIGCTLVAFLESRRQGIWTTLQAEELTSLPCMTGSEAGLAKWIRGLLESQDYANAETCLLYAWPSSKQKEMLAASSSFESAGGDNPFLSCHDALNLPPAHGDAGSRAILVLKRGETDLALMRHCERALEASGWTLSGSVMLP